MTKKVIFILALLLATVQGAWADNEWDAVYTLTQTTSANWTALNAGSTTGKTLGSAGTTTYYYVAGDLSFTNSTIGGSGLTIQGTVYLYIPSGSTLTCMGANASGQTGAGAGVELAEDNTLNLLGGGTINATGGDAANGGNGAGGTNAGGTYNVSTITGAGGKGGTGGGGAGAGIGTRGGNGGSGGSGGSGYTYNDWTTHHGTNGTSGSAGSTAGAMGGFHKVGDLGLSVITTGGAAGSTGASGGNRGRGRIDDEGNNYSVSGGGGGGAGGFGGAASNIGTGGPGGGGGGGGAGGAQDWRTTGYYDVTAYGGKGGQNGDGSYAADGAEALTSGDAYDKGLVDSNSIWGNDTANPASGDVTFGTGGSGGAKGDDTNVTKAITSETTTLTGGHYKVYYDVTIPTRITIVGTVTLDLGEGTTLHAPKGIELSYKNSRAELTINGPGALTIDDCDKNKSGIGAVEVGKLFVNGGTINVKGGADGAGIGGDCHNTNGGTIIIHGGVVNAKGGSNGAGIGGGCGRFENSDYSGWGQCGGITIYGGQVTAIGGVDAAGIGPGFSFNGFNNGTLRLGWTDSEQDFVYSSGYTSKYPDISLSSITFVEGKQFVLEDTGETATTSNIGGRKIVPYIAGQATLSGAGTEEDPWLINHTSDWNGLVENVINGNSYSGQYVKLMADIDIVRMVGANDSLPFSGTFLGNDHTITAAINGYNKGTAPFNCISGATIKNLTVAGTIASGQRHLSGLVGFAYGTNLIEGCTVKATINTSTDYTGGFIGHGKTSATTIRDCIFAGTIVGIGGNRPNVGVFWGWSDSGTPTLQNCLEKGTYTNISSMHPMGLQFGSGIIADCYYLIPQIGSPSNACTASGAYRAYTVSTAEGEMLRPLQLVDGNTYYTPCVIVTDAYYRRTGNSVDVTPVVTASNGTPLTLGTDYTATLNDAPVSAYPMSITALGIKTFTITGVGNCTGSKSANFTISGFNGEGTPESPYIISSTDEWDAFVCEVNNGNTCSGKYLRLTADIAITQKCGTVAGATPEQAFSGIFDGNGHTITATIEDNSNRGTAPFCYIDGATIRNLTTAGTITTNQAHSSGLVGFADGTNLIEGCTVKATITINCDYAGGFVGHGRSSTTTIRNGVFAGRFNGIIYNAGGWNYNPGTIGGFWGWSDNATPILENCIEVGNFDSVVYYHPMGQKSGTVTNCYYLTEPNIPATSATWTPTPNSEYGRIYTGHSATEICKSITVNNTTVYSEASTVSVEETYDYTGNPINVVPSITKPFGTLLTAGTDYSITFSPHSTVQEAGVYTMTISGMGSYVGTKTIQFKVVGPDDNKVVTSSTTELTTGAYDVAYDVTIGSRIAITGDVTLNLCGGATLNAPKGIELTSDNSLTINGPGALVINNCDKDKSGIGASSVGTLVINGGTINVTGGVFGAGIGGDRRNCAGGSITINGGTVTATGGNSAPGIGGGLDDWIGNYGLCGDITINGGQVTATGSNSAPGIGPGCEYGEQQHYGSGTLTLGWTSPTDFISNSGFTNDMGSTLKSITFADGKVFVLDGTTTLATADNIAGKKIVPALTLADKDDNSTTLETYAGATIAVVLDGRTLYKDGDWNTLCLPFDVTISGSVLDGAVVKTLSSSDYDSKTGTLTLNFTESLTEIEAGKPYIVKWNGDGTQNIVSPIFEGVTISSTATTETDGSGWVDFVGTYKPTVIYENGSEKHNLYLGSSNKLYYPTRENFMVNACRAYFRLKNGLTAGEPSTPQQPQARAFVLNFGDGEPSAISTLRADTAPAADGTYTLDGRRLTGKPTAKGLYIVNGKKIIIK